MRFALGLSVALFGVAMFIALRNTPVVFAGGETCPTTPEQAASLYGGVVAQGDRDAGWRSFGSDAVSYIGTPVSFVVPSNATLWFPPPAAPNLHFPGEYIRNGHEFTLACLPDRGVPQAESPIQICPHQVDDGLTQIGGNRLGWSTPNKWSMDSHQPVPLYYQGKPVNFTVPNHGLVEVDETTFLPRDIVTTTHFILTCYG